MEIEDKIIQRFDELHRIFPEEISSNDFRVKEVLKFFGQPSDKKILDLGCGKGRFCRKIKDAGFPNIIGAEPSTKLIEIARENNKDVEFFQASATNLPFEDNEFDFLISIEVLEHIPDTEGAIKEMKRVLKPGGKLFIMDKNILSLHPLYFFPTFLWKRFLEYKNRWFYPSHFSFKEKYFIPWKLNKILKRQNMRAKFRFIRCNFEIGGRPVFLEYLLRARDIISFVFYKIFPFLNFFVIWEGIK